jgi:Flp pilus assembly protein TadB
MIGYEYIPHFATAIFLIIMSVLLIYFIRSIISKSRNDEKFYKQLEQNLNPTNEIEVKESRFAKATKKLPELMIKAEIVDKNKPIADLQRRMTLILALLFTMFTFFFRNPMGGFLITALIYMGIQSFALYRISKKRNIMNEQIPAFVSTFKANIQANQHAQNAMIRAIDSTASPLYDELAHAKSIMEAGDFRPGIIALRRSTDNETLRQMASCIELASSSGSNIEPQIEIIEEIIKDKQIMERKKKLGVNENKPLFIVAGLFVPVSFIGSYIMSEMHREFWFKSILSWLILIGIIIATGISMFATWKIIQSVEIG